MRGITIRFGDQTYRLIKEEAAREGIGMSAFIREAALGRMIIARAHRGEYAKQPEVIQAVRDFLEAERQHRLEDPD